MSELEPPRNVAHLVEASEQRLVLPASSMDGGALAVWGLLAVGAVFGAVGLGLLLDGLLLVVLLVLGVESAAQLGLLALGPIVFGTGLMGMVAFVASLWHGYGSAVRGRSLVIEGGARHTGWFAGSLGTVSHLVLEGPPGGAIVLQSQDRTLARLGVERDVWDFDSATWAAERAASLLGVQLEDRRDETAWRRWEGDSVYRAQVRFDRRLAREKRPLFDLGRWVEPATDPPHSVDVQGLTIPIQLSIFGPTQMRVTTTHVTFQDLSVELGRVTRVGLFREMRGDIEHGVIQVLEGSEVVTLAAVPVALLSGHRPAHLKWVVEQLQAATTQVSTLEQGTAEDVPEALRQLVPETR